MAYEDTKALRRVVKARALQLRAEGKGYLQALNVIADELYRTEQGEDTPLGRIGAASSAARESMLTDVVNRVRAAVRMVQERGKATARTALDERKQQVTPWVSEAFEEAERAVQ